MQSDDTNKPRDSDGCSAKRKRFQSIGSAAETTIYKDGNALVHG
jgi:hypothetical protein